MFSKPSTQIIGNVHISPNIYVGPQAVIRADEADDEGKFTPEEELNSLGHPKPAGWSLSVVVANALTGELSSRKP